MSRWYRRYVGTVSDPKIAEAAMIAECSHSVVIATWDAILESAAETNASGEFSATPRNVAATLHERCATPERVFEAVTEMKLISDGVVLRCRGRQFESDSSTERSRRFREKARKINDGNTLQRSATLRGRYATVPDTESDTDTEAEKKASPSKKINQTAHFTSLVGDAAREAGHERTQNVQKGSGQFDLQSGSEVAPAATAADATGTPILDDGPAVARRGEGSAAPEAPAAALPSGYNPKALRPPVVTDADRRWAMDQRPAEWDEDRIAWATHVAEQAEAFEEFYAMTPRPAAEWSGVWRRVWWPKADPNIRHPEIAPQIPHPFFRRENPGWAAAVAVLKPDERKVAERHGIVQFKPTDERLPKVMNGAAHG